MHIARIITNKTFKKLLKRVQPLNKNYGELKQQQKKVTKKKKKILRLISKNKNNKKN